MKANLLREYLDDHLAGSRAALGLIDDIVKSMAPGRHRKLLKNVQGEIKADQRILKKLLQACAGKPDRLKSVATWLLGKLGKLKKAGAGSENGQLFVFEALEILELGIEGKRLLWKTLAHIDTQSRLPLRLDFIALGERAKAQRVSVAQCRLATLRSLTLAGKNDSPRSST